MVKPMAQFNLLKSSHDGHEGRCKTCRRQVRQRRYADNSLRRPECSIQEKRCSACAQIKPVTEFYRERRRPDGYYQKCKTCWKQYLAQIEEARTERLRDAPVSHKHCPVCGHTKPATEFWIRKALADGRHPICAVCVRGQRKERSKRLREDPQLRSDYEKQLQQRRDYHRANAARIAAERRRRYWQDHDQLLQAGRKYALNYRPRAAELQRLRRQRDPDRVREQARRRYQRNRDVIRGRARAWRRANLELARHQDRVYYWKNVERERLMKRRSMARLRNAGAKPSSPFGSPSHYRTVSIHAPGYGGKGERVDTIADPRILSPELAAVGAPSLQAVRAFVAQELTEDERVVLEAFADTGFSAAGAAEMLDMAEADVVAVMAAIRARAASSHLDREIE